MNKRCLSFVFGISGIALAAAAGASDFGSLSLREAIARGDLQSDLAGHHARKPGSAVFGAHGTAGAGTGDWGLLGPPGGDVTDVAASPTAAGVVLAGVAPGGTWGGTMYRSTD